MNKADYKAEQRFLARQEKLLEEMDEHKSMHVIIQCHQCGKIEGRSYWRSYDVIGDQCTDHYGLGQLRDFCVWRKEHDVNLWKARR